MVSGIILVVSPVTQGVSWIWDAADANDGILPNTGDIAGTDGTLSDATTETFCGLKTLTFGKNGCVETSSSLGDGWGSLTLFATVYRSSPTSYNAQGIVCRDFYDNTTSDSIFTLKFFETAGGQWNTTFRTTDTPSHISMNAPAQIGWSQIGMTYDGATAKFFVNGQKELQYYITGQIVTDANTLLVFGNYSDPLDPPGYGSFFGRLARVEIHDEVLPEEYFANNWQTFQNYLSTVDFSFAEFSDCHVLYADSIEIINDGVDMINADSRVLFSVIAGDLTYSSQLDQMFLARVTFDRFDEQYYPVPGNHESYVAGAYEGQFGERNYAFERMMWKFIMLDDYVSGGGPLPGDRMDWIRDRLDETDPNTPIVLCAHIPLTPSLPPGSRLANAEEVLSLFEGYNLKAVISGHLHSNLVSIENDILFTTTLTLSTSRENYEDTTARGYRLFHCSNGQITTEFVKVRDHPAPAPVVGDVNGDRNVDLADLASLASNWLGTE